MRITNNMMMKSTKLNINGNKVNLNTLNNQMSSQKKIQKPSEDPVIAIRSLRLRSSLSQISQYYEKNIPDAESWMEVTETALSNMDKILTDIHTQCVNGATDTLTQDDRNVILGQLQALAEQVYSEGNADYAGRSVFTGFKTDTTLTYNYSEPDTEYEIKQYIPSSKLEEHYYTYNNIVTPTSGNIADAVADPDWELAEPSSAIVHRMRLAYDSLGDLNSAGFEYTSTSVDGTITQMRYDMLTGEATSTIIDPSGLQVTNTVYKYDFSEKTTLELEEMEYNLDPDQIVYNRDTGELLFGENVAKEINNNDALITVEYTKKGFSKNDLKPENYYDCTNITDPEHPIEYVNYDENKVFIEENINYTVAQNQTLTVNTVANNVFDSSIGRDVDELVDAVKSSIAAHDMVTQIQKMMKQDQYADEDSQAVLKEYLAQANRQVDYADDYMKKMFSNGITGFSNYMEKVNLALTDVGSRGDRLSIIKNRMMEQQYTVKNLKSTNEDKELSDIVIDYTSAYTAYQASLQAAAKVEKQTLLDYI